MYTICLTGKCRTKMYKPSQWGAYLNMEYKYYLGNNFNQVWSSI